MQPINRQPNRVRKCIHMNDRVIPDEPMHIAILGCGGIAQKAYFPSLTSWENIHIDCLYSHTIKHAQSAARRWQIKHHTNDLKDILGSNIKAAFVLTNKESHFEIIKDLLVNGIDVYSEKPLVVNSAQALALAQLAEHHQRILMVGFNRRYALLYQKARELMGQEKIQLAIIQKHRPSPHYTSLHDALLEDSIHQIDLMRFYCGEVKVIHTDVEYKHGFLHSAMCTAVLPSGGLAQLITSHMAGAWQESVTLYGNNLSIHVNAFRDMKIYYQDHEELYGADRPGNWIPDLTERGFSGEIKRFFQCVEKRETPESNADEAAKTQLLLEDILTKTQNV